MTKARRTRAHLILAGLAVALMSAPGSVPNASANVPTGPCCFPDRSCEELIESACEDQGGVFIAVGASCSETICPYTQAAPVFTFFGLVSVMGGLIGLGLYRLLFRRS